MDNNTILALAEISLQGKNYQDSYEKYSKLIEIDINNPRAWIGKGISAGYLSNVSKSTFDEVEVCLNYALKLNPEDSDKEKVLENLIPIAEYYIRLQIGKANGVIDEKAKEPLSTFQLSGVRNVQQTAERYKANNQIFDSVFKAIQFTNVGFNFGAEESFRKKQIILIDTFLKIINSEIHEEKKRELNTLRAEIISQISKVDQTYTAPESPKSGGCFIATTIYQSESHPKVVELRNFRDTFLIKSKTGREFISIYYKYSPQISSKLLGQTTINMLIKKTILEPLIWLIKK